MGRVARWLDATFNTTTRDFSLAVLTSAQSSHEASLKGK